MLRDSFIALNNISLINIHFMYFLLYQFDGSNSFVLLQKLKDKGDWDMKIVENGGVFWIAEAVLYKDEPIELVIPSIYNSPSLIRCSEKNMWKLR
jgi:hypothetical protein